MNYEIEKQWVLKKLEEKRVLSSHYLHDSLISKFKVSSVDASVLLTTMISEGKVRAEFKDSHPYLSLGVMTPEDLRKFFDATQAVITQLRGL